MFFVVVNSPVFGFCQCTDMTNEKYRYLFKGCFVKNLGHILQKVCFFSRGVC